MKNKKLAIVAILGVVLLLSPVIQASSDIETRLNNLEKRVEALETRIDELVSLIQSYLSQTGSKTQSEPKTQKKTRAPEGIDIDISTKVTVKSSSSWKYAWRLTIKNNRDESVLLDAVIEFQDEDGFIIDSDKKYDLSVGGTKEEVFTGYELISLPEAKEVSRVYVEVEID